MNGITKKQINDKNKTSKKKIEIQFEIRSGISFLIIIIIQVLKIFWGRELSEMEARLMKTH